MKWVCPYEIVYNAVRYSQTVTVPIGYPSDGASGAPDIWSEAWWVHDVLCDRGTFDSGDPCTPRQASMVLADILWAEGHKIRAVTWGLATFLWTSAFGIGKRGMRRVAVSEGGGA